jgi:rubrerythrin
MKRTTEKRATEVGKNLTGIGLSPVDSKKLIEFAQRTEAPPGDEHDLQEARETVSEQSGVIGSVPPPSTFKGLAKAALDTLKGNNVVAFIDRLGERAGFERTGTRLYEAMLAKVDALGSFDGGPTRERLEEIRDEELEHLGAIEEAIASLGGDATVMTPAADLAGVEGAGLVQVLTDPRTTVEQCLGALLIAELADNDGWALLAELARSMGHDRIADTFTMALAEEAAHLRDVRRWVAASTGQVAAPEIPVSGAASPPPAPSPAI